MKSKIENFFLDSNDIENFKVKYIDYFKQALSQVDEIKLSVVLEEIISCQKRGGKIISFGNGGSAANAAHFCTGISYVTRNWESPISAMSLNQDTIFTPWQ